MGEPLGSIAVPVLVLCGEEGRLCPVERHERICDPIADSRLEIIAGAGHLPTLERPERTNRVLKEWLRT